MVAFQEIDSCTRLPVMGVAHVLVLDVVGPVQETGMSISHERTAIGNATLATHSKLDGLDIAKKFLS